MGVAVKIDFYNFDILMLLGDNYGVTIYKNSGGTTATPFSNKVSVEILDRVFLIGFYSQASNRYTSK